MPCDYAKVSTDGKRCQRILERTLNAPLAPAFRGFALAGCVVASGPGPYPPPPPAPRVEVAPRRTRIHRPLLSGLSSSRRRREKPWFGSRDAGIGMVADMFGSTATTSSGLSGDTGNRGVGCGTAITGRGLGATGVSAKRRNVGACPCDRRRGHRRKRFVNGRFARCPSRHARRGCALVLIDGMHAAGGHPIKSCQSILGAGSSRLSTETSPALKIEAAGFRDGEWWLNRLAGFLGYLHRPGCRSCGRGGLRLGGLYPRRSGPLCIWARSAPFEVVFSKPGGTQLRARSIIFSVNDRYAAVSAARRTNEWAIHSCCVFRVSKGLLLVRRRSTNCCVSSTAS